MEFRNRTTGAVVTEQQFRSDNPNTSFPQVLTPEIIDGFDYDPVLEGPQPILIPPYQYSERNGVIEINGKWYTHYIAGPNFQDYTDETGVTHTAAEQYEAYCFEKDKKQASAIRTTRNKLLANSDWTQLIDSPLNVEKKTEWLVYRQDLRLIPEQQGFPWEIAWPKQPD